VIEEIYYVIKTINFTNLMKCSNIIFENGEGKYLKPSFLAKSRFELCGTKVKPEKKMVLFGILMNYKAFVNFPQWIFCCKI